MIVVCMMYDARIGIGGARQFFILMDDIHHLKARHFRYELCRGGKIFSSKTKFGARKVCIAPVLATNFTDQLCS